MTAARIDNVLGRLQGVKQTGQNIWLAFCPIHESPPNGHTPSLSIKLAGDTVLLHCHSCGKAATPEILKVLRLSMKDLFTGTPGRAKAASASAAPRPPASPAPKAKKSRMIYKTAEEAFAAAGRQADGQFVSAWKYPGDAFRVARFALAAGGKTFRPIHRNGAGWSIGDPAGALPLYRGDIIGDAGPVVVTEGEKCADEAASVGLVTVTSAHGGGSAHKGEWAALAGREVVILPDNDATGDRYALEVATILNKLTPPATVKIVVLPGLGDGGDIADWIEADGPMGSKSADEIKAAILDLAQQAKPWTPPAPTPETEPSGDRPLTDSGNAELLARVYGDRLRFNHRRGRWLVWTGNYWSEDVDGAAQRLALAVARERQRAAITILDADLKRRTFAFGLASESRARREATLALARSEKPLADAGDGWDSDPLLLACRNGVVELETGRFRPGRPEDRLTLAVPHSYIPTATCPRWEQFLLEVLPDPEVRLFLSLSLGYCTTGLTKEQCWFLLLGTGANGKSTLLTTVAHVLGPLGLNLPFTTFTSQWNRTQTNDLAAIEGRRLLTASEASDGAAFDESRLKAMAGEDVITARFLYGENFTFRPVGKIVLAANHRPTVRDDSPAFWRRCRLIDFPRQFSPGEMDSDLSAKLKAETEGIFTWLVRQAGAYLRERLSVPQSVMLSVAAYRADSDLLGDFLSECCFQDPEARASAADLYGSYTRWAEGSNLLLRDRLTRTGFGRRLADRFLRTKPDGRRAIYTGLGLYPASAFTRP